MKTVAVQYSTVKEFNSDMQEHNLVSRMIDIKNVSNFEK
jgi:hypothetical protein